MTAPKLTEAQRACMWRVLYAMRLRFNAENRDVVRAEFGDRVTPQETKHVHEAKRIPQKLWDGLREIGMIDGVPPRLTDAGRAALRGES